MLKKIQLYRQLFFNCLAIIGLAIVQLSFIGELPGMYSNLNLVLVSLLFVLVLAGLKFSILWTIIAGFLLDIFSFQAFGLNLITLTLTILALYFLLNSFFTNRSLYSIVALTFFATIINKLFWFVLLNFLKIFGVENSIAFFSLDFLLNLLTQLFLNVVASILIFQTVNFISHKLKPVFLIRSKKI